MLPSSWLFCYCSYLHSIATLFYIKLILKALFCFQKTRKNIKKKCDKTFNQNSLYFFSTQVQHFFHISHTHGMIKLKGMRNDNVNERMMDWAKVIRNQKWFPITHGFPLCFYIFYLSYYAPHDILVKTTLSCRN